MACFYRNIPALRYCLSYCNRVRFFVKFKTKTGIYAQWRGREGEGQSSPVGTLKGRHFCALRSLPRNDILVPFCRVFLCVIFFEMFTRLNINYRKYITL